MRAAPNCTRGDCMQALPLARGPCFVAQRQQPHRRRQCVAVVQAAAQTDTKVLAEVTKRIKQLGRAGKPREAVAELASMASLGVQPDLLAATALLDAAARNGRMDMALSIFDELFTGLLVPDEVAYSIMIKGHGESDPPKWTAISSMLNKMEGEHGMKPSVVTFNALLAICARSNDEQRAQEIIGRMAAAGVEPDEFTLDAVRQKRSMRSMLKRTFGSL